MNLIDTETYEGWRSKPASETFELIEAAKFGDNLLSRVCRTVTAFLNTSGGLMVLNVHGEQPTSGFVDELFATIDRDVAPRPGVDVEVAQVPGVRSEVILVDVPVGRESPYSYKGQILLRAGASTQAADRKKILALIGEHEDPELRWERQVLAAASEQDLDLERIEMCAQREDIRRPVDAWRASHDEPFPWWLLHYFHLGKRPFLRNGAIALFGRAPAVFFPQLAIRAVAYEVDEAEAKGISDEKIFSRNIFENIEGCFSFLERNVILSSSFPTAEDRSFQRTSRGDYPFSAIREAVLNAIVHRDFESFDAVVTIKVTPSRIEIWNPGAFPPGTNLERLEEFRISRSPNPDIAHVLQRMGYIERLGSGINRIIRVFEKNKLPRPIWEEVGGGVRLTLDLISTSRTAIEELAQKVLSGLEVGEVLSRTRLESMSRLSSAQFHAVIEFLLNKGSLQEVDPDRFRVGPHY